MVYLIPLPPCFVSVFSSSCVPEGSSHQPLQYVDIVGGGGGTALHIFNFLLSKYYPSPYIFLLNVEHRAGEQHYRRSVPFTAHRIYPRETSLGHWKKLRSFIMCIPLLHTRQSSGLYVVAALLVSGDVTLARVKQS